MADVIVMSDPNDPNFKDRLVRFLLRHVLWIVLLILVVMLAFGHVYTIPSDSKGIVLRFGKITKVVEPGLHFKMPLADKVYVVAAARTRSLEFGYRISRRNGEDVDRPLGDERLMLTKDNKLIEVEWVLHFHIGAPDRYLFSLPESDTDKVKMLRDLCMGTMRRIFAGMMFDEGLTSGKQKIQEQAFKTLQATFDRLDSGITIDEVLLQETNVSDSIKDDYNSVTTAEEEVKTKIYQAEAHSNKVIPEAEGRASILVNEAEAYKFKRISEAEGEAARLTLLQDAYKLNPELTRLNMWVDGMSDVWRGFNVVFVEGLNNSGGSLKVLPLSPDTLFRRLTSGNEKGEQN